MKSKGLQIMSYILLVLYWSVFLISMFFCQKIYVVELLFALQFAYMTMIPIGVYCPPFSSLSILKYSFGWNGIPFPLDQTYINVNYSALGIQSNILSNVNFMVFIMLLCPVFYGILTALGNRSIHYKAKPRLLTYGKTFVLDILFTIFLINIPNICTSIVVSLQSFWTSNMLSFIISILMALFLLVGGILWIVFKNSFREYKLEFKDR
jgi:hypothetical protein